MEEKTQDNDFKNYQIDDRECKAFHFSPDGRWCQSFVIVWTPGYLNVIGDMGNLIIQISALEDFERGMRWLSNHANENSDYFMEKVKNFKCDVFDSEGTKQSLISVFKEMESDDIQACAKDYLEFSFLDRIFDYDLSKDYELSEKSVDEEPYYIKGSDVVEKLEAYQLDESDIENIVDCELIRCSYNWDFLNCRIRAIREFAVKQLEMLGENNDRRNDEHKVRESMCIK